METQTKRYETEALTAPELARLKRLVLGYGNLLKAAETAQMPRITLKTVIDRGSGRPETIARIREKLLTNIL